MSVAMQPYKVSNKCKNIGKTVIKFLQGNVVSQTVLGGLASLYIIQLLISYSASAAS